MSPGDDPTADAAAEHRVRAAEVVARLRFARWSRRTSTLRDALLALAFVTVPLAAGLAFRFEPRRVLSGALAQSTLAVAGLVLVLGFFVLSAMGSMLLAASSLPAVLLSVTSAALQGPTALRARLARRDAEAELLAGREPGPAWTGDRPWRRDVLASLAAEDPALTFDGQVLRLVPTAVPLRCPSCGAWLRAVGAGVRRCAHCAYERYDERPPRAEALRAAQKRVPGSGDAPSRSTLFWRVFRAEAAEGVGLLRWGAVVVAGEVCLGALADLITFGLGKPMNVVAMLALAAVVLALLPLCWLLGYGGYLVLQALLAVRPGLRAWDEALGVELASVVLQQGCISIADLAQHLGVSEGLVHGQVTRLEAYGRLPLYFDRAAGRLFALQAGGAGSNRCPACGGRLRVGAAARQRCEHCGGVSLGRAPSPATPGASPG